MRAWQADGRVVFFGGDWIIGLVPHAGRDRPVKGQRHDQDQPGEAVGILDMGLFEAEPARFEVGEHGLDAPARCIIEGGQISRLGRHGDDPGLGMSGIANDADVGRDPLAGEDDSLEIMATRQGERAGGGCCCAPAGEEIALEPQAIVPSPIATPPDHRGLRLASASNSAA